MSHDFIIAQTRNRKTNYKSDVQSSSTFRYLIKKHDILIEHYIALYKVRFTNNSNVLSEPKLVIQLNFMCKINIVKKQHASIHSILHYQRN